MVLFDKKETAVFALEADCESGIFEIAQKVAKDMKRVCGKEPPIIRVPEENGQQSKKALVLFATVGKSRILEQLTSCGALSLSGISGKREVFGIFLLKGEELADTALSGSCSELLFICGSDKRGTIYGMFHLSERMGVSPLYFWGDAKPVRKEQMMLDPDIEMISKEPSVAYRGFFINDEWPCFGNWTTRRYDGFTAEMYEQVFELLLRLKGNYLWPAMWSSSFALDGPGEESAKLADRYGVIMGNSHHEPCLRAGEEWDIYKGENTPYGCEWNYMTNKAGLLRYWEDGLKRSGAYESIITVGMRGERDSIMEGPDSLAENIEVLKKIITNQKQMIARYGRKNGRVQPMLLAIYKEVEAYYYGDDTTPGLKDWEGLDDVILMFCEDNFGHMRYLPSEKEPHEAGYGMYFHLDYHGEPISYEWINSTPLTAIWEQMTIAYEQGVRKVWMVNVGDLKGNEFPLSYFMELAYDFEAWGSNAPNRTRQFTEQWLRRQFGDQLPKGQITRLTALMTEGILLIAKCRPEALGSDTYGVGKTARHMERRLDILEQQLCGLEQELSSAAKVPFYSMIADPLRMGFNLLRMQICAGFNKHYAAQGKTIANLYEQKVRACITIDRALIARAGERENGKWSGMWDTSHIGFQKWNEDGCRYPVIRHVEPFARPRMVISRMGEAPICQKNYGEPEYLEIDDLAWNEDGEAVIEVANDGTGSFTFDVEPVSGNWFQWEITNRTVIDQEYLYLRRRCAPTEDDSDGRLLLRAGETVIAVHIPAQSTRRKMTILAKDFVRADTRVLTLSDFGKEGSGVKAYPFTAAFRGEEQVNVTYQLSDCADAQYRVTLAFAPSNPISKDHPLYVMLRNRTSGETWKKLRILPEDYCAGDGADPVWADGVLAQQHCISCELRMIRGENELQIGFLDGISVLEKIELELN